MQLKTVLGSYSISKSPGYSRLRRFLRNQLQMDEYVAQDILIDVFEIVCVGDGFREVMDYFNERERESSKSAIWDLRSIWIPMQRKSL